MGILGVEKWKTWKDAFTFQEAYEVANTNNTTPVLLCFGAGFPRVCLPAYLQLVGMQKNNTH